MVQCTFFNSNSWFNAFLNFFMGIGYSSLSCKFAAIFSTFQFSFLEVKRVNGYESYVNVQDIEYQLQENFLSHFHL